MASGSLDQIENGAFGVLDAVAELAEAQASIGQSHIVLHILCSYPSRPLVKIITLYEPDPTEWDKNRVCKARQ